MKKYLFFASLLSLASLSSCVVSETPGSLVEHDGLYAIEIGMEANNVSVSNDTIFCTLDMAPSIQAVSVVSSTLDGYAEPAVVSGFNVQTTSGTECGERSDGWGCGFPQIVAGYSKITVTTLVDLPAYPAMWTSKGFSHTYTLAVAPSAQDLPKHIPEIGTYRILYDEELGVYCWQMK